MVKDELTLSSVVSQTQDHVSTELDGETVLMCIKQGHYYGMDKILSRVWAIIEKPIKVSVLCDQLVREYEVARDKCEEEILDVLNKLLNEKLLKTTA